MLFFIPGCNTEEKKNIRAAENEIIIQTKKSVRSNSFGKTVKLIQGVSMPPVSDSDRDRDIGKDCKNNMV